MFEPLFIFGSVVIWSFIIYYVGYTMGHKDAKNEFIAAVVKRVDAKDEEHLVKLINDAAEKENLLLTERKRLTKIILKEAKRQREMTEDSTVDDYVDFGDVSREQLGEQCQYGSRYIDGSIKGWPNLGGGLRFTGYDNDGHVNNYHAMKIHRDDVAEFVRRVKVYHNDNN